MPSEAILTKARQPPALAGAGAERLHEFQRHTDARQVLVGIRAVVAFGIDHRDRVRQRALGLVVVGDDQIDAEFPRPARRLRPTDPAVDRHDDVDLVGVEPIDRGRLEPVAVPQTLRDEMDDFPAEHLECAPEDDCRRDAIDVVVAVDCDPLTVRQRPLETGDGPLHVGEEKRIVKMVE